MPEPIDEYEKLPHFSDFQLGTSYKASPYQYIQTKDQQNTSKLPILNDYAQGEETVKSYNHYRVGRILDHTKILKYVDHFLVGIELLTSIEEGIDKPSILVELYKYAIEKNFLQYNESRYQ